MKEIFIATYKTSNKYFGHSKINRYHWEVSFDCIKIDFSEERDIGIKINGFDPKDILQLVFQNANGDIIRRSNFDTRESANKAVKKYIEQGWRKEDK